MAPNITSPKTTEKEGGSRFAENEREGMGPKGASPMKGGEGRCSEGASPGTIKTNRGSKHCFTDEGGEGVWLRRCFADEGREGAWVRRCFADNGSEGTWLRSRFAEDERDKPWAQRCFTEGERDKPWAQRRFADEGRGGAYI